MDQHDDATPERRFGRYRVRKTLGKGGMGVVYLAEDPGIGREVAIKVLHVDEQTRPDLRVEVQRRFEIEARSAGRLSHPNIVTIHDIGKEGDAPYIAMEYVPGESLEDVLASDRRLTYKETSDLTAQLCRALDYAHGHGIVHRDIKPANILLAQDGQPKIVDFGVAKMGQALGSDAPRLTQVGAIIGTPAYMSPEQVTGHEVTPASDQFSLAVIVYEMLTGKVPFAGEGATTVMYQIVHGEPKSLRQFNKRLPGSIDAAIFRALDKDPTRRYPTCADFARAVREALQSAPESGDAEPEADRTVVLQPVDATVVLEPDAPAAPAADATVVMNPPGDDHTVVMSPAPEPAIDPPAAPTPPPQQAPVTTGPSRPAPPQTAPQPSSGADRSAQIAALAARLGELPRAAQIGAGAAVLLIVVLLAWAMSGSAPEPTAEVTANAEGPRAMAAPALLSGREELKPPNTLQLATLTTWRLEILGASGNELWVDGERADLTVPGELEILGRTGGVVSLELRDGGTTIASTDLTLSPYMPAEWPARTVAGGGSQPARRPARSAPVASTESYRIDTRPAGARVRLDGTPVEGVTPLTIEVQSDRRYQLSIELDGHDPLAWSFTPEELPAQTRESGALFFPLVAAATANTPGPASKLSTSGSPDPGFAGQGEPVDPIRIRGARMEPAEVLEKWEPDYPDWAAEAGLPSYVILELVIDRQGRLRSATVLREVNADLERLAIEAVRRWRFQPATNDGVPVDAYFNVSVQFQR